MKNSPLTNIEKQFIRNSLTQEGIRIDGRKPLISRNLHFNLFEEQYGVVEVSLGFSRVLCRITPSITPPHPDRPSEGIIRFTLNFSPMSSPEYYYTMPVTDRCVQISRVVERVFRETQCIDTETLCLIHGHSVWTLDINDDGGLFDCCSIACLTGLRRFRLPYVTIENREININSFSSFVPLPLTLHHYPLSCTFAFLNSGKNIIIDPLIKEELSMDTLFILALNSQDEICALQHTGVLSISTDECLKLISIASKQIEAWNYQINQEIERENKKILDIYERHRLLS